jgi:hypothetical protein
VTAYRLNGLLSFRETGAAFLLPFFTTGGSNKVFVQEVDNRGCITRFHQVDADNYYSTLHVTPDIIRRAGEEGVFAARLRNGSIHLGNFQELRGKLAAIDLEQLGSPFFNVDALAFIGDLSARDRAVVAASKLFRNANVRHEWRRLEVHGRVAGLNSADIEPSAGFEDGARNPVPDIAERNLRPDKRPVGILRAERALRQGIASRVADKLGVNLVYQRGALFESKEKSVRVVVLMSRRYYGAGKSYWYGFYDTQRSYLMEVPFPYLVLASADTEQCWAIPNSLVEPLLAFMSTTKRRNGQAYWHVTTKVVGEGCILVAGDRRLDIASHEVP